MRLGTDMAGLGPSLLFCPGDRPERFAKAAARADTVVLDLEDGVAAAAKDAARAAVVTYIQDTRAACMVRINHPTTERGLADALAVIAVGCQTMLLPKTETLAEVEHVLALVGTATGITLVGTIETARGLAGLAGLLAPGLLAGISWGPYDLAADTGMREVRTAEGRLLPPLDYARSHLLLCAAAARTAVYDTVTAELNDPSVLERDAREASMLGFSGKFCIHPSQVEPIRRAFLPTDAELARSRRMLEAAAGQGAFLFEGDMVDEPMLRRARDILARVGRGEVGNELEALP